MSHGLHPAQADSSELASFETRLASLEARFANSWATQTRDEYEKAVKENLKQEVINYARVVVVAAALFLLGTGYVLLRAAAVQVFEDRSAKLSSEVRDKTNKEIDHERLESKWARFHNYGITYRYLAEFWQNTQMPEPQKRAFYNKAFHKAEDYYSRAIGYDDGQATSYYERAQLHYSLAKKFDLPEWKDNRQALDDYNSASQSYDTEDVRRGWRADAYKEMGMIYLEWALTSHNPNETKTNVSRSFDCLSKAEHDYQHSEPSEDVKQGLGDTKKLLKCFQTDGSLSGNCDEKTLKALLDAPM